MFDIYVHNSGGGLQPPLRRGQACMLAEIQDRTK